MSNSVAQADAFAEAGLSEITVGISGLDYDLGKLREVLQWCDRYNSEHQ